VYIHQPRTENIIESPWWPYFLPFPTVIVEKTFADFMDIISIEKTNDANLLLAILERSNNISDVQNQLNRRLRRRRLKREQEMKKSFIDMSENSGKDQRWSFLGGHISKSENDEIGLSTIPDGAARSEKTVSYGSIA